MDHSSHGRSRDSGPADQGERADGRHGKHHALERCAGLGAGQAACEVSGLDAGKNGGRIPVDQPAVDRRYRARFRAGKLDEEVCYCWCEGPSRGRDPAGERRALALPNTSGSFVVPVSVKT